jgi:MoxR-like ATPase
MSQQDLDREMRLRVGAFDTRLREVKSGFVARDQAIDLVALAALCREHVLLVGPPGTAKTRLLDQFRRMLDARYFSYLLTRFTEPAELFGTINFTRFRHDSEYEINVTGMLPDAHVVFLDEVFQGSSAILNSLLAIINERTFNNGRRILDVPLITLLGASNEVPDDPLLRAFSDRFLLRLRLDYVPDDAIEDVLEVGWETERSSITSNGDRQPNRFPLPDLELLQREVANVDVTGVRGDFIQILRDFRAEGIAFSDRRAVKAQKTFAAAALRAGRTRAELEDLWPLVHVWTDPRDEPTMRRIVEDRGVPVEEAAAMTVRDPREIKLQLGQLRRERGGLRSLEECRELLRQLGRIGAEVRRDHPGQRELLGEVQREQLDVMAHCREQFQNREQFDEGGIPSV